MVDNSGLVIMGKSDLCDNDSSTIIFDASTNGIGVPLKCHIFEGQCHTLVDDECTPLECLDCHFASIGRFDSGISHDSKWFVRPNLNLAVTIQRDISATCKG